jgi:hypothetical protein
MAVPEVERFVPWGELNRSLRYFAKCETHENFDGSYIDGFVGYSGFPICYVPDSNE